ncbi:MAG: hypothetical protein HY692_02900 [Cyanobacteria bacterium NC_groundwater_1444_Ag_S-0.65um_54_12]|nr:hypothetical protein [Cyanobacteria bacterium NC_groundwater_1444_Ag_S-0.65um_54_12]
MSNRSIWWLAMMLVASCHPNQVNDLAAPLPQFGVMLGKASVTLVLPPPGERSYAHASERQLLAAPSATSYRITIRGADLATAIETMVADAATAATIEIANVPPGSQRLFTVQALTASGQVIPGASWLAVAPILSAHNEVVLSPGSTAVGQVWARWLDTGQGALAAKHDPDAVLRRLTVIKRDLGLPHFALLDADRWADAVQAASGSLEVTTTGLSIAPAAVNVTLRGVPDETFAKIWVDDPISPRQSGLSPNSSQTSGLYQVAPLLPGNWIIWAAVPGLGIASKSLLVAAGATADVTLDFPGWEAGPALPKALGNAAVVTDGRFVYVIGGVLRGGSASSACWKLDTGAPTPSWEALPELPLAREGAVAAIVSGKLYVAGGRSGFSYLTTVAAIDLANPVNWQSIPAPPLPTSFAYSAQSDMIGALVEGTTFNLLWSIFDEHEFPPFAQGHVQRYDPAGSVWLTDPANFPPPRTTRRRAGFGLFNNYLVIAGGDRQEVQEGNAFATDTLQALAIVETFNLLTRRWSSWPDLLTPRSELTISPGGNYLYAAGGVDAQDHALTTVERYDPARGDWSAAPPLRVARSAFGLVEASGKLWAIGGSPSRQLNRLQTSALALSEVETLTLEIIR